MLLGINRNTINLYFNEFCLKIPAYTHHKGSLFLGEIELDESWMNRIRARRVKGKWDRGAAADPCFLCPQTGRKCLCRDRSKLLKK